MEKSLWAIRQFPFSDINLTYIWDGRGDVDDDVLNNITNLGIIELPLFGDFFIIYQTTALGFFKYFKLKMILIVYISFYMGTEAKTVSTTVAILMS